MAALNKILISKQDKHLLDDFHWGVNKQGYVVRYIWKPKRKVVLLHREIMNPPSDMQVDHKDLNRLNNRRSNLRICTPAQNIQNTNKRSTNKSGYKHICFDKFAGYWKVQIIIDGKKKYHNMFLELKDAVRSRDEFIAKHNPEWGRL